jgi:hypothetical protein
VLHNNVSIDPAGRSMAQHLADWQSHVPALDLSARHIRNRQQQVASEQHVQVSIAFCSDTDGWLAAMVVLHTDNLAIVES